MELQSILDAPDSESSQEGGVGGAEEGEEGQPVADILNSSDDFSMLSSSFGKNFQIKKKKFHRKDVADDLDLERILNEYDEDDEDDDIDEFKDPSRGLSSFFGITSHYNRNAVASYPTAMSPSARRAVNALHNLDSDYQNNYGNDNPNHNDHEDGYSLGGSSISTRTNMFASSQIPIASQSSPSFPTGTGIGVTENIVLARNHQNPKDWAILQRILNDVDDDDDDDDDVDLKVAMGQIQPDAKQIHPNKITTANTRHTSDSLEGSAKEFDWKQLQRVKSNASSTMDVDAILNSIDSDEDDNEDANDLAEIDAMIARFSMNQSTIDKSKKTMAGGQIFGGVPKLSQEVSTRMETFQSVLGTQPKDKRDGQNKGIGSVDGIIGQQDIHGLTHGLSKPTSVDEYFQKYQASSKNKVGLASDMALKHAEEYERQLLKPGQCDIVSPLMVKRRMKPKIELQTKSRIQKQQLQQQQQYKIPAHKKISTTISSNILQQSPFNFSGMIELKNMQKISSELQNSIQNKDVGLPTALCISSKFIAVGTQRGVVLVFDLFEELRQELGLGRGLNDNESTFANSIATFDNHGSVSSIDISSNGENLVAGYTTGTLILWDVIKGTMLKSLRDVHPSPITILRFISEKSLSIVSVDAGGLVNKLTFVKTMLWSNYNVETECLLDGTAGQILAMNVLPPMSSLKTVPMCITENKKKQPYHPSVHKLVLLALSSDRGSFAIAVEPSVSVLHRWARPSEEQINTARFISELKGGSRCDRPSSPPSAFLPCLSWGWALVSGGENTVTPILARGWGCCIQLLRANFPHIDDDDGDAKADDKMLWPAFGLHDEFDTVAPVLALEWLGDRSLVFLTLTNELVIVDTVMMTLTERLDFSGLKLVFAEFALSQTAHSSTPANVPCTSTAFQNSIRSSEDRLLVLCQEEVKSISLVGIRHRVSALVEDGEWLEALALSLDHYEFTIKSQEDRRRNHDGTKDISNHPEFISRIRLTEDEEWIGDLLLSYITLAVDNAPETTFDSTKPSRIDLAQSHYQMLAGVCIEFCVVTRRLDLLFNEVYQCFRNSRYTGVFLDVLEPYVLNDKLRYVAPSVMSEFIDHHKALGDISTVERCLLHMDVTIMDFDSILSLLRKHGLFSALIHVYTQGLDDYTAPLEILFDACFDAADGLRHGESVSLEDCVFQRCGYKILLFFRHSLSKKMFPTGVRVASDERVATMRPELLSVLLRKQYDAPRPSRMTVHERSIRKRTYPYIYALVKLDPKAFLDTINILFDDSEVKFAIENYANEIVEDWENFVPLDVDSSQNESDLCPSRMYLVRAVAFVLSDMRKTDPESFISGDALGTFHDFLGKYLLRGVIRVPPSVVCDIISRMSARSLQEKIISLLQVLPRNSYSRKDVLEIVEGSKLSRAALILHKGGVMELIENGTDPSRCSYYFKSSIDCYLNDKDASFQREVFEYIKSICIGGNTIIIQHEKNREATMHDVLRIALCEKLPALINLDPIPCTQLLAEIFVDELDEILSSLECNRDDLVLFKFYHAVISGDLTKVDSVSGHVLLANMTVNHHQKYLELMAQFHPDMVYHHLTSCDSYRVEECLKLCQEYEIADASAYLLEKMGNVSSALQLMLQTLEGRLMTLKRVIRGLSLSTHQNKGTKFFTRRSLNARCIVANLSKGKEFQGVRQILTFGLDLCERNSGPSSNNDHGSQLWFNVLDRLMNSRSFLRLSKELPEHSEIMFNVLSDLLRMTMQRMVSSVPLPDLVMKITTDHTGSHLGELRDMVTSMLSAFLSEVEVCGGAANAMHYDVKKLSVALFYLKVSCNKCIQYHKFLKSSNISCGISQVKGTRARSLSKYTTESSVGPTICISSRGDASIVDYAEFNRTEKDSRQDHISRLRSKRLKKTIGKVKNTGKAKVRHGMLSKMEKIFQLGESSDAAFMPRHIGILSEAEHFGRLRRL
jgi:WD40 repeat protein